MNATQIEELVERQGYRCALTGRTVTPETAHIDHIRPLGSGGGSEIENLQVLHKAVNIAKGTLSQEDFIQLCRDVAEHAAR